MRVVVRHAHEHERHWIETDYGSLDRFVNLRVRVEEADVVQAFASVRVRLWFAATLPLIFTHSFRFSLLLNGKICHICAKI